MEEKNKNAYQDLIEKYQDFTLQNLKFNWRLWYTLATYITKGWCLNI